MVTAGGALQSGALGEASARETPDKRATAATVENFMMNMKL